MQAYSSILGVLLVAMATPAVSDDANSGATLGFNQPRAKVAEPVLLPRASDVVAASPAEADTAEPAPPVPTPTPVNTARAAMEATPLPVSGQANNQPGTPANPGTSWMTSSEAKVFGLLALLAVAAMVYRRYGGKAPIGGGRIAGGGRPSGVVQILARYPLGRGQQVMLMECGPRVILVHQQGGRSGGAVQVLTEFVNRDEVAELRRRLEAGSRDSDESFRKDLEQSLGVYGRDGAKVGVGGAPLPATDSIETVDLTRRRPRRGLRGTG